MKPNSASPTFHPHTGPFLLNLTFYTEKHVVDFNTFLSLDIKRLNIVFFLIPKNLTVLTLDTVMLVWRGERGSLAA